MANWYRLTECAGYTTITAKGTITGVPRIINSVPFGTDNNPLFGLYTGVVSGYATFRTYYTSSSYVNLTLDAYNNTYYGTLNYSTNKSNFRIYRNKTISGKRRFRNTLFSNIISGFGVMINYAIDGVGYNFIGNTDRAYYISTENKSYSVVFGNITINGQSVEQNVESIITEGSTLNNKFANKVIDFGSVEQNLPDFLYNWIIDNTDEVLPYKISVYNYVGDTEYNTIEIPSIKQYSLGILGNRVTLELLGVNDIEYNITWDTIIPTGKTFLGLANSPNSNRPFIIVGNDITVSWSGDFTLYESFGTYRPPATSFDVNLYQNSAEVNRVDKTDYLTSVGTLTGALREECSMLTPSIVYQSSDVPTFNYVYIPIFNRYYYVTSLSSVSKNVWRMELNCDVLMSYKEQIYLLQGVIGRQENDYNPLLIDTELPTQNNPLLEVIDIPSTVFNTQNNEDGHTFLLTVIGA